MIYLTINDFKPFIEDIILNQVIQNNPALLDTIELMAIDEIKSYLETRFNTNDIFSKTGNNRHSIVVMLLVDIVLYHLHSRVAPRNISQIRTERYNQAIDYLKNAALGTIQPPLPLKLDTNNNPDDRFKWGSNDKLFQRF